MKMTIMKMIWKVRLAFTCQNGRHDISPPSFYSINPGLHYQPGASDFLSSSIDTEINQTKMSIKCVQDKSRSHYYNKISDGHL